MTRGAEPRFADTPYAQWIKARLSALGWNKQDLAEALRVEAGGRLAQAGADGLVHRATKGDNISAGNRELIASVLGSDPPDPELLAERLEVLVVQGERLVAELPGLLAAARELRGEG